MLCILMVESIKKRTCDLPKAELEFQRWLEQAQRIKDYKDFIKEKYGDLKNGDKKENEA